MSEQPKLFHGGVPMQRIIWILAVLAIVFGALLTWGAHALLVNGSDWLTANPDLLASYPEWQSWLRWGLEIGSGVGVVALWAVWGISSVTIALGAWVISWLITRRAAPASSSMAN
jgi:hypothetical protein